MRIPTVPAQAAATLLDVRASRRPAGGATTGGTSAALPTAQAAAAPRPGVPMPTAGLPDAVAGRLSVLLAQDPGLAEAVTAQLPAARRDSARDLAAYGAGTAVRHLDLAG